MAYLRHLYLTENCFLDIDSIREAIFFGKLLKIIQNEIKTGINENVKVSTPILFCTFDNVQ